MTDLNLQVQNSKEFGFDVLDWSFNLLMNINVSLDNNMDSVFSNS